MITIIRKTERRETIEETLVLTSHIGCGNPSCSGVVEPTPNNNRHYKLVGWFRVKCSQCLNTTTIINEAEYDKARLHIQTAIALPKAGGIR